MSKVEELSGIVADEQQPIGSRKVAAEHLIQLRIEAIEAESVPDDDPEIAQLTQPWSNTKLAELWSPTPNAPALKGRSLPDAKLVVMKRRKLRMLLGVVCNDAAHRLEQLASCEELLQHHATRKWVLNGFTAERLLTEALPSGTLKYDSASWKRGPIPVNRPPRELNDLWRF